MTSIRRLILTGASTLVLAASLMLAAGCKAKSHPQPFTATLTEIDGVQAIYTFRHPKLIAEDLNKPTTDIPEAAMLRMFLGQLAPYGYPEFSDIAAGSNIGIAMLELTPDALKSRIPQLVGFARLKEGGKIQTALEASGLVFQKHGDWMWIARDASLFAKIKNPDAITAYIDRPQTEDLRGWGRLSPDLLTRAKTFLLPKIQAKLANRPADEQKALVAYFDVLWGYLAQIHSLGGSLSLGDHGITITNSAQFLPDGSIGTFLRYTPGPAPKIAQSTPVGDALFSGVFRQNIEGQIEFIGTVFDSLIAVDYPSISESLKTAKTNFLAFEANADGGGAGTMTMSMPIDGQPPKVDLFGVCSGHFTQEQVTAYYKASLALSEKSTNAMLAFISALSPHAPMPEIHQQMAENVLTINGINFGSIVTTSKITAAGKATTTTTTQYYGVVGGNLVVATDEAVLREKLPAVIAGQSVPDPVQPAGSLVADDQLALMEVHGGKIVDIAVKTAKIDASDADIKGQIKSIKDGYADSGPISVSLSGAQAQATATLFIPYKFIEQSIHLGQFISSFKNSSEAPQNAMPSSAAGAASSDSATPAPVEMPAETPAAAPAQ